MHQTPLREVRLYGHLGRRFGRIHRLAVESAAEAVRALIATLEGFEAAITQHRPGWHLRVGSTTVGELERLRDPVSSGEVIKIIPAIAGAKSAWGQILIGVALVAVAVLSAGTALGGMVLWGAGASATTLAGLAGSIGVGLALGGVAQLLAPKPSYQAGSDAGDQKQSYVFSGPINTSQQGVGVPIIYGRMIVGSVVVSTGLDVRELPT